MNNKNKDNKTIYISQEDWGETLALRTHLGVILKTAYTFSDKELIGKQPLQIDSGQLLLAAASLRALILDSAAKPLLISFIEKNNIELIINSFEGDFAMLFYSQNKPEKHGHLAHFLLSFIVLEEFQKNFAVDTKEEICLFTEDLAPDSLKHRFDVWLPRDQNSDHSGVTLANGTQFSQIFHITRKHVSIDNWKNLKMGFLKDTPIKRERIIDYVANKLGGVHFDKSHHTKDKKRQNEFRLISQAFNWENQAIMHGAIVAIAICVIELATCPKIIEIYDQLLNIDNKRRNRLMAGEPIPQKK